MIALIIALGVLMLAGLSTAMVRQTRVMHRNLRYRARIIEAQRGRIMMLECRVGEALVQERSVPRQAQSYPGASDGGLSWQETEEAFQRAAQRMRELQPDGAADPVAFPWAEAYQQACDGSMHRRTFREGEVPADALRIDTLSASRILADPVVDLSKRPEPVDCEVTRPGITVGDPRMNYMQVSSDGIVTVYQQAEPGGLKYMVASYPLNNPRTIPTNIVKE